MTDKTQSRRELITNIGKGTAIASGGLIASSTTATASGGTEFSVEDGVPGSYELVEEHAKGPRIMPYKIGWTVGYSVPSKTTVEVVLGESNWDKEIRKTLRGSGEFTEWTYMTGRDEVRIQSPRPKWHID